MYYLLKLDGKNLKIECIFPSIPNKVVSLLKVGKENDITLAKALSKCEHLSENNLSFVQCDYYLLRTE